MPSVNVGYCRRCSWLVTSRFVLLVSEGVGGFVGSPDPLASSWARNICQHSDTGGEEERAEGLVCSRPGPGISGAAQLGMAALFICPDLAFAPEKNLEHIPALHFLFHRVPLLE
ncbi:hypothetical protein PFLUV_G00265310 [Perca fluviatilis]|uniref:Uncharacterized protein n=1 Tax=Perca fluviatilis TaxID=8168 RepID=A0A6A5DNM3_PERFL|nr:hypothetical protein PFLUV_G00265310 [Perca fluviatilis]